MKITPKKIRIAVTGPESTGKTTLAKQLAEHFNGLFIPEYAREYVESLSEHYTYADVEMIAKKQIDQYLETQESFETIFFFDTWLIVTKVWFSWVFGRIPDWLEHRINTCPVDLFLLCSPDLPWEADSVRENGGENRIRLFEQYKLELKHYNFNFVEICGTGNERLDNAIRAIRDFGIFPE